MKLKNNVTFTKIALLVLFVLGFDFILEFGIVQIRNHSNILDDYLVSGIIVQMTMMTLGIILYVLFIDKHLFRNLFSKGNGNLTKKYVRNFTIIFPILLILVYALVYFFDAFTWDSLTQTSAITNPPLWKVFVFELIFPGVGEETLYRGFLLTLLALPLFFGNKTLSKPRFIGSILLTSLVFTIAHFGYGFSPFNMYYDGYQLITAFVMGCVEGYVFLKTKNLLGPILIHNISNIMLTAFPLLIGLIF